MQAQVLHAWGDALTYEKVPTPAPGRGEVLIRVEACGVGLTVLNYMNGNMDRRPELLPRIPGHEFVGTVAAVGPEVHAPRVGERVMAYFYLACGHCDYCRLAHEPLCRNLRGNVGVVTNGGYAEYAVLPAFNCLPVPERLSAIEATAVIDAIATPFHVNRRAGIGPSDLVMVVGAAGGVGIHMVQMSRLFGATVIAVDVNAEKLAVTRELGATAAIDFTAADAREALRAVAPSGVTAAIDLVGRAETLAFCLEALDRRGRLVMLTTFAGAGLDVSPRQFVRDEVSVLGSRYASRWEVSQAALLVSEGKIKPIVSDIVPLERVGEINAKLRARTLLGRGAVTC
jgi:D-arabinose 1-dehydrogenase-like Zn-dependent alcohol dehydrogenase